MSNMKACPWTGGMFAGRGEGKVILNESAAADMFRDVWDRQKEVQRAVEEGTGDKADVHELRVLDWVIGRYRLWLRLA